MLKEVRQMIIHKIIEGTTVNGPGLRLGVWVQGCKRNCLGCFNEEVCTANGGTQMTIEQIVKLLDKQNYDGITVSGGEPFDQESELALLLKEVKAKGKNTLVFTGYIYDEVYTTESIKYCDYLIDGPFIKDIPPICKYTGSGNQRFLRLENGLIAEDLTIKYRGADDSEIIISADGTILVTGFSKFNEEYAIYGR